MNKPSALVDGGSDSVAATKRREFIVEMYLAGSTIAEIKEAAGTTTIYPVLRLAGIEPTRAPRYRGERLKQARAAIIDALATAAADLGATKMKIVDYQQWRTGHGEAPSVQLMTRLFGSWTGALRAAGIAPGNQMNQFSRIDAIASLKAAASDANGNALSRSFYDQWRMSGASGAPSAAQIHSRFGWTTALVEAGLDPGLRIPRAAENPHSRTGRPPSFTDDDLVEAVRAAHSDIGGPLTISSYTAWRGAHPGRPGADVIRSRIGWSRVKDLVGVPTRFETQAEAVAKAMRAAEESIGRSPTKREYEYWATDKPVPNWRAVSRHYRWSTSSMKKRRA